MGVLIIVTLYVTSTELERPLQLDVFPKWLSQRMRHDSEHATFEDAEIVLFVESHCDTASSGHFLEKVFSHPIYRAAPAKCVVHSGRDRPFPRIPGFYPSIEAPWHREWWTRSSCYLVEPNPYLSADVQRMTAFKHLASFVGVCDRKPVRQNLLAVGGDDILVQDTGGPFIRSIRNNDHNTLRRLKGDYVRSMLESRFVLCPRGIGTSSIRLFEAMQVGRCPVIISDEWVEPHGPHWSECSVRVEERDLENIPTILRALESRSIEMGQNARAEWKRWFSPPSVLEAMGQQGLELLSMASARRVIAKGYLCRQIVRPTHTSQLWRQAKTALKGKRR